MNVNMDIVEQSVKDVSDMFAECLQEVYKGYYPDTRFDIYVSYPKVVNSFNKFQSNIHLRVSSDVVDQVELNNKVAATRYPVIDCVNNKLKSYQDDFPLDPSQSYSFAFTHNDSLENHPSEIFDLDKSEFLHIIETSLKSNFYAKIYNIKDVVKELFFIERMIEFITDRDIRDFILYLYRNYDESQIDDFIKNHGRIIIDTVKEIIGMF